MRRYFVTAQKGHGPVMLGARNVGRKPNATAEEVEASLTRIEGTLAGWTPDCGSACNFDPHLGVIGVQK